MFITKMAMERRSLRMELRRVAVAFSSFSSHASSALLSLSICSQVGEAEKEGEEDDSDFTPLPSSAFVVMSAALVSSGMGFSALPFTNLSSPADMSLCPASGAQMW